MDSSNYNGFMKAILRMKKVSGWCDGCKSRFKDCLQQSKTLNVNVIFNSNSACNNFHMNAPNFYSFLEDFVYSE